MNTHLLPFLIAPFACMLLRRFTGAYIFSALVTLTCMALVLLARAPGWPVLALGLAFSVAGDWFLAHTGGGHSARFLYGVCGFFLAHACFLAYTLSKTRFSYGSLIVGLILVAGYTVLMIRVIYPNVKGTPLKIALGLYMLISVAVFSLSLSSSRETLPKVLFCVGIFLIMFSDTLIGVGKYMRFKRMDDWILPTYYLCHIFLTASALCQ